MARTPDTEKQCDHEVELQLGREGEHGCGVLRAAARLEHHDVDADVVRLHCDHQLNHGGHDHGALLLLADADGERVALTLSWRHVLPGTEASGNDQVDKPSLVGRR